MIKRVKRGSREEQELNEAQVNPNTDFSMDESLIDISFFAVTAGVRFPRAKCIDVHMIAVSTVPDNSLPHRLSILHLKVILDFFPPLARIVCCPAKARQQ